MSLDYGLETYDIGLESIRPYPQFYRQRGIRMAMQLAQPLIHPMEELDLPLGTIIHHISDDDTSYGISTDDYMLQGATRMIMVEHLIKLATELGPPKTTSLPPGKMWRDYHKRYRRTRLCPRRELALKDDRTVLVQNYALLNHLWRYNASLLRVYYKWFNIQSTMWANVEEIAQQTNRPQYIQFRMPNQLPTLEQLKVGANRDQMTPEILKKFRGTESLWLLELWKWIEGRPSVMDAVSAENLFKVNLVFTEGDKWCLVTLGHLRSWVKSESNPKGKLDVKQMQRRVLRLMMTMVDTRSVDEVVTADGKTTAPPPITGGEVKPATAPTGGQRDAEGEATETETTVAKEKPVVIKVDTGDGKTKPVKLGKKVNWDELDDKELETDENIEAVDAAIQRELDALEEAARRREEAAEQRPESAVEFGSDEDSEVHVSYQAEERDLITGITTKADELLDAGQISGPEYRRFQSLARAYEKLSDPYGEPGKTLADRVKIDKEKLKLDSVPVMPDRGTVKDKSLLNSSLQDFNTRYVKDVLPADITSSVLNVQRAGVVVTSYTVERKEDAFNAYEEHVVQLTPVQGKSSMIHFRVPVVNEDGTYQANGVRYRLRTQRGDVPIRKLSPDKVALTSYYSRIFVQRSEKQVNNRTGWLTNRVVNMSTDPDNTRVKNVMLSDVFDQATSVPRIYSTMAQRIRSFQVDDHMFFFDYHARKAQYGEERVTLVEKDGLVVAGASGKLLIVVDKANVFSTITDSGELTELGTMENMLELEGGGPLEVVELKLFSKTIPLGVLLAYHMGLTELCKVMKITPRIVPTGTRASLQSDEFALKFEDEQWIFSRTHPLVEMIIGGLARFERDTRNYPAHQFDRKSIYINILENNKIGPRYFREFDLMIELFVDPITRDILEDMKEPTDFIGLLFRSAELLTTDWSPAETDMAYMRLKGYERFAGTVYTELVKAIRVQRSRGSAAKAKIDIAPHAVWKELQEDAAVKLVEESNPVHNMREKEEVTYSGTGGRSGRTMVARTRVFHKNDMGVISESTKDSADVAITTFMTADPNIVSLRGVCRQYDPTSDGAGKLLSSPALLSPGADRDD